MKGKVLLIVACLAAAFTAFGASAAKKIDREQGDGGGSSRPTQPADPTYMSEKTRWACEVALCMANPSGPMAVAECVPPIQKLQRELAKGHAYPVCPFVASGGGGNTGGGSRGGGGNDQTRQQIK
jgi:hypothetical protein